MRRRVRYVTSAACIAMIALTVLASQAELAGQTTGPARRPPCDPDNGGITLPEGFCATVFADGVGRPRHIVVAPNGDVFVALAGGRGQRGGVLALRDTNGDGKADVQEQFGDNGGNGIALRGEYLYFAPNDAVLRYRLPSGQLKASGRPDTIVAGLPADRNHAAKTIVVDNAGNLFVNIGSPSNTCQVQDRQPGSPGMDPCPELETRAGIWRFSADRLRQKQSDGQRYATGIRNAVALTIHPVNGGLYGMQHGRDQLYANWSNLFTAEQSAEKPSEELIRIQEGDDFGWPYCYHDPELGRKVLAPEYGGDGRTVGRCASAKQPLLAFPAHWAPNAILFYTGNQFPERYRNGAFIAFHGSWNRAPLPQAGYNVVFVPFNGDRPAGTYEIFANGFAGENVQPGTARHRPTGLAQGPDGALYITDDAGGRIWRVVYTGTR
jgi:glucose/arabinose dehydrogenase